MWEEICQACFAMATRLVVLGTLALFCVCGVWGFSRGILSQSRRGFIIARGAEVGDRDTAVIIVDHGSRRAEANDMLLSLAAMYKSHSKVPIVEAAHMEMAVPSIADAYKRCVEQGAKHIICHPFFLAPGRHVQEDIPLLMKEASIQHPHVTYTITEPLGVQNGVIELISQAIEASREGNK